MRLILSSSAKLGLSGCAIGGLVAVFAARFLRSLLFEVDPLDPVTIVLAALSIFCWLRRIHDSSLPRRPR